jgi:hypothetical protein
MRFTVSSPVGPIILLFHGLLILLAILYYMGIPWQRIYTMGLFGFAFIWGMITVTKRFRERLPVRNRIDFLFAAFLLAVLISLATHWWEGSIKRLVLLPFLMILPYILGRVMRPKDVFMLPGSFIFVALLLLILIFPEYLRYMQYGYQYIDSPYPVLFDKNVSVMMSGNLLGISLISLVFISLIQGSESDDQSLRSGRMHYFLYVGILVISFLLVWIGSRGPLLVAIIGMGVLLFLFPPTFSMRKIKILLVIVVSLVIAFTATMQRNASLVHYTNLLKSPMGHWTPAETKEPSSKQTLGGASVLGPSKCDHIFDSISDRWIHFHQAVTLFLQKPLIGVGANQYGFHSCQGPGAFPHNIILHTFVELGWVVGVLYSYLLWMTISVPLGLCRPLQRKRWGSLGYWLTAFCIMQILLALISGDYFVSAAVYFIMGFAASGLDSNSINENH